MSAVEAGDEVRADRMLRVMFAAIAANETNLERG